VAPVVARAAERCGVCVLPVVARAAERCGVCVLPVVVRGVCVCCRTPPLSHLTVGGVGAQLLRNREHLDPKHFYKSGAAKDLAAGLLGTGGSGGAGGSKGRGIVGMGTVVEGPHEFWSARIPKAHRSSTILAAVMQDERLMAYGHRVTAAEERANRAASRRKLSHGHGPAVRSKQPRKGK